MGGRSGRWFLKGLFLKDNPEIRGSGLEFRVEGVGLGGTGFSFSGLGSGFVVSVLEKGLRASGVAFRVW